MATVTVDCPFCHTNNDPAATGGYCDSCGRRLPVSAAFVHSTRKPRRVAPGDDAPSEAHKPRRQTAEALVTASVLRLVLGGILLFVGPMLYKLLGTEVPTYFLPVLLGFTVAGTAFFALLALLARSQPFPAALAALAGLLGSWAAVVALHPVSAAMAGIDVILLLWLGWTLMLSRDDRL